jgi:iron complex transport system substrate-binding protein
LSRKLAFILFVLVLFLAACAGSEAPVTPPASDSSISLLDGLERTVTLSAPAQRIVSLAPANTEILFAIGAGDQIVGRDSFSDYPPESGSVQDIGGSFGEYDLEAILALQPDLVLAGEINSPELVASLEDLGLTVFLLPNPTGFTELYNNLETVGKLTGHVTEAADLSESLSARVDAVESATMSVTDIPGVYYELDATNPAAPYTAGTDAYVTKLIWAAGGKNIMFGTYEEWITISLEQLLVADPDIIILGDAAYGETPEKVAARPGWDALTAVQTGQIFPIDDNLVSRPGPRLVDGLEAILELLHPGLMK